MSAISLGAFWRKNYYKKIKKIFWPKIYDFSDFFFEKSKIHLFGPRNPLGWASHVVLGQNQWLRAKNGICKKCTENV